MNAKWVIGMLMVLALVASVRGRAIPDSESDDESDAREVSVTLNSAGDNLKVESSSGVDENELKFEVKLASGSPTEIRVEYETGTDNIEVESKSRVVLHRLVGYTDANGNGMYDAGEEDTTYNIGTDGTFSSIVQTTDTTATGLTVYHWSTTDGIVSLTFHLSPVPFTLASGHVLAPEMIKFDVRFNYTPSGAAAANMALLMEIRAETEEELEERENDDDFDGDDGLVVATGGKPVDPVAAFSWVPTFTYDGTSTGTVVQGPIIPAADMDALVGSFGDGDDFDPEDGETRFGVWFSFPVNSDDVFWDPAVSVLNVGSAAMVAPSVAMLILLASAAVAVVV
jgi:hypothetical protein